MIELDTALVLLAALFAFALHPVRERLSLALRYRRNGYSCRAAWHMAERR